MNRSNYWFTYFLVWLFLAMTESNKNMEEPVGISFGNKVKEGSGKWPFMVAFFFRNETGPYHSFCAGTLIHDRAIMTAAHCLLPNGFHLVPKDLVLMMGNENLYKFEDKRNVIGLAQKVCLPPTDDEWLYDKKKCIAMGWGKTERGYKSPELRVVKLPVVDDDTCRRYQPEGLWYNPEIMFCAGYKLGGKSACSGDSGGPFMCPLKEGPTKYVQLGIISRGKGCGGELQFGYYARVTHYLNWIKESATFNHDEL